MAKIYRLKKEWGRTLTNGTIGFRIHSKNGDLFVEEYADYKYPFYYPFDGGYAVWESDNLKFVDEYFEFVEETEHPKEYFTQKKYTEYDMEMALKTNLNNMTPKELKEKYPPPIIWTEYRTSVKSVEKLWMTGLTTNEPNSPCYVNFHIIFKNGERKDFSKYEDPDKLLADVTEFLKSIKI